MSKILIVGGGAVGLSVAYHLGLRGARDVTLLERARLTSGTSWHAAGIVGPLRATPNMTRLASHALEAFPRLEKETGLATGYRRTGGYWLAREEERLDELRRIADLGVTQGMTPRMVAPKDVLAPHLDTGGLVGALHVPEDGSVDPNDLCMAYARGAAARGVDIREGVRVDAVTVRRGRAVGVALADGAQMRADRVVLCAGVWSRALAAGAGVALPLQAVEHMYVVTEPMAGLPNPFPVVRDLDRGVYVKGDAGKLVIGGFEANAKCWDPEGPEGDRPFLELNEDWDQFAPFMEAALTLIPALEKTGIRRFMNGPEGFTSDTRPLVGETPEVDGLFVAAGMNSVGVMSSAGIGRALADWLADGHPAEDLWEIDIARTDPITVPHMAARMEEAVADVFALHWPYKQPRAGRGVRVSALHDRWADAGGVFGLTAGWERGLWYARDSSERDLPYATGAQPWWPIAAREAAEMTAGCVLLDLGPFTKIDLAGPDLAAALDRLTTARMDIAEGRAVYTQLLNARGGIEMDATLARLDADRFHLTSGAATRRRDLAYLRRHLSCTIADATEAFCTIGVMGAGAAATLARVAPDARWDGVPLGAVRDRKLAGQACRATRMSFVGEYGWELTVPNAGSGAVFEALSAAGARPMGHYALDGCRIEKGFRHWGCDIGPDVTPLEAGLGFTIDWGKDFLGKAALLAQRAEGVRRRLILMRIDGEALMLHDEPIYEGGAHVGLTTSGARGPRTGLNLAFGMVAVAPGETPDQTRARRFRVRVAGRDYPARPLERPPFDPEGERMRA